MTPWIVLQEATRQRVAVFDQTSFGKLPVTLTINLIAPNGQKIKIKTKRLTLKPHRHRRHHRH